MHGSIVRFGSFLALLTLTATTANAQYSIQKIEIHGAAPFTETEVLDVSGLQPRQMMSQDSLGNAAQHLLDTINAALTSMLGKKGVHHTISSSSVPAATRAHSSHWSSDSQTHLVDPTINFIPARDQ